MASKPQVRITGVREVTRDLEWFRVNASDMKDAARRIADEAAQVVRRFIPVLTGTLRASPRAGVRRGEAFVNVGEALPYAGPIAWGTPRIEASNYPAKTDAVMDQRVPVLLEQGIEDLIRKRNLS